MFGECICCGNEIELEYTCDVCGAEVCPDCIDYAHDGLSNVGYCADCGSNGSLEEYLDTVGED